MHKSGFVNIIGNPNVGKSTLMNALVGERLSIITSKAQTTRHRILGIVNGDDFQIVYSDTPGILKPNYKLHESMMKVVQGALKDADIILYVTDVTEGTEHRNEFVDKILRSGIKTILVINKIDLTTPDKLEQLVDEWRHILPDALIVPVSAAHNFNIGGLFDRILELLPEGEPFYPKDALTDKSLRFFASEIIREKILLNYEKEIPYSVEISIEEYKEVKERYDFMKAQVTDVEKSRAELNRMIAELCSEMQEMFTASFKEINRNFGAIFRELFGGGSARLYLSDENDVLNSGIEIQVSPPGKVIKNLSALSGGEQALVAISIYFAILAVNPSPFCILDEIEAALDDVNVTRYAQYLRRMTERTQFIVITHRRGTMEAADVLYGVTMQEDGVSKILRLDLENVSADLIS